ncbi:MAG: SpoIIE family protein phosphatase [Ignavibacteriae bacterium]|nr:SpoIIE family protein phosphatase [Ignavibacteria bacterium]MBI3363849.1 SpoIIE family protein phosphatase [Ignavibacteriota bacterium]
MKTPTTLDRLRHNILFENVADKEFNAVKRQLHERRYSADETILKDESEGEDLYLLVDGRVKIVKKTRTGEEKLLALLHEGDFFGELELVDGRTRSAEVVAVDDCLCYSLHKTDFEHLLNHSHPFAVRLMYVLSLRLRTSNNNFVRELEHNAERFSRELKRSEQLIEASKVLNSTLDLDKLLLIILETALRSVDGDRGTVYLIDEVRQELWSKVVKGTELVRIQLPMGKGIAGYVAATGDTLNITDAYLDPRFNPDVDKKTGYHTETILCMPMKNKNGKIIGVFQLLNKRSGVFTSEDESIIAALSIHAALAIENARLYEEEKAFMQMREEVRLAAKIQHELLPKAFPKISGYDIAGQSIPAQLVGGDYFDFIPMHGDRLGICLGDVTGKGLPASLLMANVQATLRGQSLTSRSAKECIARSNTLLYRSTSSEKFVTLFYGILDPANHRLEFCNAGQDHPFLFSSRRKSPRRLDTGGTVLGIIDGYPFSEESISIEKGNVLVIYSDGIAEAINEREEQFGEERLAAVIKKHKHRSAQQLIDEIVAAAKAHAAEYPQSDDMTIVVMKRTL